MNPGPIRLPGWRLPGTLGYGRAMRLAGTVLPLLAFATAGILVQTGTAAADNRVYPTAEAVEPLAPGSRVPAVKVETVKGDPVDLVETLRDRGALLVFYRGGW